MVGSGDRGMAGRAGCGAGAGPHFDDSGIDAYGSSEPAESFLRRSLEKPEALEPSGEIGSSEAASDSARESMSGSLPEMLGAGDAFARGIVQRRQPRSLAGKLARPLPNLASTFAGDRGAKLLF